MRRGWVRKLARRREQDRRWVVSRLTRPQQRGLLAHWGLRPAQLPPAGDWRVWLMLAGRGFGKTRAGAEWVHSLARADASLRIALIGATREEVGRVMVQGESGLMATAQPGEDLLFYPSRGLVEFASGARAFVYSGRTPEALRGPQHDHAWCDELAKWRYPEETWSNLRLGLRLREKARILVTTTPRPIALLQRLLAAPDTEATGGATMENDMLPADFVEDMIALYGGTRLGRQELNGELIGDIEGALWTRALIERCRGPAPDPARLVRVVIGVDPPASARGDACGIVVCGKDADGIGHVLADHSCAGLSPEGWARAVARAAEQWQADRVIVETNQGGEMVASVLRSVDAALPVKPVTARFGKGQRAEPVLARFEAGKARFAGAFPALEDELCGMTLDGYRGPGRSPDRADAMVWALATLLLGRTRTPRIRAL
jgi:phage terminase large subunit-like protein